MKGLSVGTSVGSRGMGFDFTVVSGRVNHSATAQPRIMEGEARQKWTLMYNVHFIPSRFYSECSGSSKLFGMAAASDRCRARVYSYLHFYFAFKNVNVLINDKT